MPEAGLRHHPLHERRSKAEGRLERHLLEPPFGVQGEGRIRRGPPRWPWAIRAGRPQARDRGAQPVPGTGAPPRVPLSSGSLAQRPQGLLLIGG